MPLDSHWLAARLDEALARHRVPGAQVGLRTATERVVVSAGLLTAGSDAPVLDETRFHAGSLAKALTGQWVREAALQGQIDLDVPCSEQSSVGWDDTPLELLTQTSGRPNELPEAGEGLEDFAARVGAMPRVHAPGRFSYCNSGWSVLDLLLHERTGSGFAAHLVGGDGGGVGGTFGMPAAAALGHASGAGGEPVDVPPTYVEAAAAAGACWWASAGELLDLAERHLHPEEHGWDPALVEQLRAPAARLPGSTVFDAWGQGWASWHRGEHEAFGWAGLTGGHRSYLRAFPRHDAAIVVLTNCAGGLFGGPGGAALFDELLPDLLDQVGVPPLTDPDSAPPRWLPQELAGQYGPVLVTTAGPMSLRIGAQAFGAGDLVLDRAWGDTFEVQGRPPGAMPVAFDGIGVDPEWLYLGPFAVPRVV